MSVSQHTLPKSERLCGVNRVDSLFKEGSSFVCYPFRVLWKEMQADTGPSACFMVSVSKRKLKHALDRNRVKRLVREAYRLNKHLLLEKPGYAFHVAFIWIPSETLPFEKVNQKMNASLKRIINHGMEQKEREHDANNASTLA